MTMNASRDEIRLLLTGDLHFDKGSFEWLEARKDEYDCFCLTGDFLDSQAGDFEQQTRWVADWLKNLDKQVFVCSGNHDIDADAEADWLTCLRSAKICVDNQKKVLSGITFGCIPYLGADLGHFHDCDVLLAHVPPYKTATSQTMVAGRAKDWGDKELYRAIKTRIISPRYLFCGHVENPLAEKDCLFGVQVFNPGGGHGLEVNKCESIVITVG